MKNKFDFIWDTEKRKEEEIKKKEQIKTLAKNLNDKRTTRHTYMLISILILLFVIIFLLPIFSIEKFEVEGNKFLNDDLIIKETGIKERTSLLKLFIKDKKLDSKSEYVEEVNLNYKLSSKTLVIVVDEIKPAYHDDKTNYYLNNNEELVKTNKAFSSPYIDSSVKDKNLKDQIVSEIVKLPYDIFLQINTISYGKYKKDNNVLLISMYDGNDIFIYPEQIYSKMKYYNQIKYILDKNKKGPGNIYLFMGDYYESKN